MAKNDSRWGIVHLQTYPLVLTLPFANKVMLARSLDSREFNAALVAPSTSAE